MLGGTNKGRAGRPPWGLVLAIPGRCQVGERPPAVSVGMTACKSDQARRFNAMACRNLSEQLSPIVKQVEWFCSASPWDKEDRRRRRLQLAAQVEVDAV